MLAQLNLRGLLRQLKANAIAKITIRMFLGIAKCALTSAISVRRASQFANNALKMLYSLKANANVQQVSTKMEQSVFNVMRDVLLVILPTSVYNAQTAIIPVLPLKTIANASLAS